MSGLLQVPLTLPSPPVGERVGEAQPSPTRSWVRGYAKASEMCSERQPMGSFQ
jgi:hypothetical protein